VAPAAPPHFWHRRSSLRLVRGTHGAVRGVPTGLHTYKGAHANRVASMVRQRHLHSMSL
jgi:hypothetical protein